MSTCPPPAQLERLLDEQLGDAEQRDVAEHVSACARCQAALEQHAPIQDEYRGPAYWVPDAGAVPENVVLIGAANAHLLQAGFAWLIAPAQQPESGPVAAAIAQGMAVSVCFCSRLPGQATEAGLETLEPFRGRGYAAAAVIGWAAAVRQRGILPLYSTSWANHASQAVARKLGMVRYGEDWSIS